MDDEELFIDLKNPEQRKQFLTISIILLVIIGIMIIINIIIVL